jgi:hypothetical protein
MTEIRIDADKAERMIAQILREEKGLLPADANAAAANICRRLTTAMPTPTNPTLVAYRIIPKSPPYGSDFNNAVAKILAQAKGDLWNASVLWTLCYDHGRDLPAMVFDP